MTEDQQEAENAEARPMRYEYQATAFILYMFAEDYFEAAENHNTKAGKSPAKYYLYSHSIELILKSFLIAKGMKKKRVREKFGHDVARLWRACERKGVGDFVSLTDDDVKVLAAVRRSNRKGYTMRYPNIRLFLGSPEYPEIVSLRTLAERLLRELRDECLVTRLEVKPIEDETETKPKQD